MVILNDYPMYEHQVASYSIRYLKNILIPTCKKFMDLFTDKCL